MLMQLVGTTLGVELATEDRNKMIPVVVLLAATVGALLVFLVMLSKKESLRSILQDSQRLKERAEEAREELRTRTEGLRDERRASIDELLEEARQDLEDLQRMARSRMEEIRLQAQIAAKKAEIEYLKARARAAKR